MADLAPRSRWEKLASLSSPRAYSAAVCVDGIVYVIGGCNKIGQPLDIVESFSFETKKWTQLPSLKVKRAQPTAVLFQGKIVVIGGCKEMNEPVKEVGSSTMWNLTQTSHLFGGRMVQNCFASLGLF